jgi:hypothetical protein
VSGAAACTGCGGPLSAGQRFCRRCGTPVASAAGSAPPAGSPPASSTGCPKCGHALVPNARFCRGCGAALTPDAAVARPSRELASPDGALSPATDPERFRATMPEIEMPPPRRAARPSPDSPPGGAPSPPRPPRPPRGLRARRLAAALVAGALVVAGGVLVGSALSGKGATPDTPLPSISRAEMTRRIRTMFRDYHQSLADGRLDHAFSLISERKQQSVRDGDGLDAWKRFGASFGRQIDPSHLQVSIVETDREAGVAGVRISGMPYRDPASPCTTWSGVTWVKYEHGAFHYDPGYSTTRERRITWEPRQLETLGFAATRRPSTADAARVRSACGS